MIELLPLPGKMKKAEIEVIEEDQEDVSSRSSESEESASQKPLTPTVEGAVAVGDEEDKQLSARSICILKYVAISSTLMSVILLVVVIILAFHLGAIEYCIQGYMVPQKASRPGVFDDMTADEYAAVSNYMFHKSGIKLLAIEQATPNSSYIYMIDLHMPLKSAVLEYLDRGSVRLKRAAKVVVVRGDLKTPKVEEYLVSPLPVPSTHRLARNPSYTRYPIPYSSRPTDQVDYRHLYPIITEFTERVYNILMESYGLCYHNCSKGHNCMLFRDVAPRGRSSGDRNTWFQAFRDVDGFYLHPIGLEVQIKHETPDVSAWSIDRVSYNGQLMYTVNDFLDRYNNNKIRKITTRRPLGRFDQLYSSYHRRGSSEMPDHQRGPRLFEPDGHRFTVTGQHVKYMNWDFDIRMRPSTGLQIFDVRFQSERIGYEISLQDGVQFSSGYGPAQGMRNVYLASWMIGASSFELVRGVDCPDTASYLGTTHLVNSGHPTHTRNAICVFEQDPGIPLRRHYADDQHGGYRSYGGIIDYQLIVRHIASILSSDYIFDYIFHLNGEIEIRVSPTGYVPATYKLPFEKLYGNPLHYEVMSNVHQHLFHFKIDLDIRRVENRYSIVEIDTETIRHPWYPHVNKTQFIVTEKKLEREMDVVIEQLDKPSYHIIYDENPLNEFGTRRAYRILNKGASLFMLDDVEVTNAANWAKYPVVVTKYDDTEEQSSSIYAQNDPWEPVVDFERFVMDNDTIVNEDLVVWASLGLYHLPSTEDVPSASTSWQTQSLHLVPFNFFSECPSVSSANTVQIIPDKHYKDEVPEIRVNTYGVSQESTCVPPIYGPQTYYGFREEG